MRAWWRAMRGGVALGLCGALATPAAARDTVGVGGVVFIDDGELVDYERRSILQDRERFAYGSDGFLGASAWWLRDLGQRFRVGGKLSWFGSYGVVEDGEDDAAPFEYGHLMALAGRGELVAPMAERFDLLVGAELGLLVLFTGGDLEDEIAAWEAQGVALWSGPRLGWSLSGTAGARWRYGERLALRGEVGVGYGALWIYDTEETVQGIPFAKERDLTFWRYALTLGIEVAL